VQTICIISVDPDFREICEQALPLAKVISPDIGDLVCRVIEMRAAVILYDVVHVDEWEDVTRLRMAPQTRDVPLIVLTGWIWADGRSRRRARELQCAAVIAKPCRLNVLVDALQRAVVDHSEA
jgi:CheY-like chemotaxis protein